MPTTLSIKDLALEYLEIVGGADVDCNIDKTQTNHFEYILDTTLDFSTAP
jgi:hypothetical protein